MPILKIKINDKSVLKIDVTSIKEAKEIDKKKLEENENYTFVFSTINFINRTENTMNITFIRSIFNQKTTLNKQ